MTPFIPPKGLPDGDVGRADYLGAANMPQDVPTHPVRILVAEDNESHQHLLLLNIVDQKANAEVRVVSTGADLLKCVREDSYDCVVLDFNLPDFRADELVQSAAEHLTATPVVIVSANTDQSVVIDSFRSGVVDFVPKDEAMVGDALWRSIEHAIQENRRLTNERREQDRRERYLAKLAETDQLTGLYNRRYFERCIDEGRWDSDRRKTMSVVMLDIDHFKQINDTHGHHAGDDTLCQTADFILTQIDGSDIAIRWGGEEFVIIRPSASLVDSMIWAERLRRLIEHRGIHWKDQAINITVSTGIHECHADELNRGVIDRADDAMYLAKERGRNQVCTSLMADMCKLAREVGGDRSLEPRGRFERFIELASPLLGPTQRDHTTDHAEQVATMAREIARILKLPEDLQRQIHTAGLLHDIGKCMIPEAVLAKRGRLTLMERAIVSKHAEYGAEIAEELGFDSQVSCFIREHHTRYDAMESDADHAEHTAHIGSRVLCATDALVTMMTCRTYQSPKSLVEALRELRQEKNRQFDPDVVNAAHFIESLFSLAA